MKSTTRYLRAISNSEFRLLRASKINERPTCDMVIIPFRHLSDRTRFRLHRKWWTKKNWKDAQTNYKLAGGGWIPLITKEIDAEELVGVSIQHLNHIQRKHIVL